MSGDMKDSPIVQCFQRERMKVSQGIKMIESDM